MTIIDRIVLALYTIFMGCVSLVTMLCSLDLIPHKYIGSVIAGIPGSTIDCVGAAILFLVSLRLLVANLSFSEQSLLISEGDKGRVRVEKSAIEDYAKMLAGEVYGVYSVKAGADLEEDGIYVRINASVEPGTVIPTVEKEVQTNVSVGIQNVTGVPVKRVDWFVKNIKSKE